jgi:3' terminal RNA ribose 2'-O-methyltransferase Hen1
VLLTISTTLAPATDLGYLLHKHPDRVQSTALSMGEAFVFYPDAGADRCTAALLLEIDPIALARGRRGGDNDAFALGQYVNDRPYAASSFLSVALSKVFRTAMAGRCDARPELAASPLPLEIRVPALPSKGDADLASRLFEPLGWNVDATSIPLDPELSWGETGYVDLRLTGSLMLSSALRQLYVLLPVFDDAKHYWVGPDEVDKLFNAGRGWLDEHPERHLIVDRYLKHQRRLVRDATERLLDLDGAAPADEAERPTPLRRLRVEAVLDALQVVGASSVVDLGCGEGALLRELVTRPQFRRVVGVDVAHRSLERAAVVLNLRELSDTQRERVTLRQSSAVYRDEEIAGADAIVLMEVIEHIDSARLPTVERNVFGAARPRAVVVTTPNREHNVKFPSLVAGFRHPDHRFEWTRAEFAEWTSRVGRAYDFDVELRPVGESDPDVGPPTQLALFTRQPGVPS